MCGRGDYQVKRGICELACLISAMLDYLVHLTKICGSDKFKCDDMGISLYSAAGDLNKVYRAHMSNQTKLIFGITSTTFI